MSRLFAEYIVNGVKLNMGQSMVIHTALQSYAMEMSKKNALGKDEIGENMRKGYLERIREIQKIAHG
jgi:hypothetical protein